MSTPESPIGPADNPQPEKPDESLIAVVVASLQPPLRNGVRMSSTWEDPDEDAPVEAPSPSDVPTGGENTGEGEATKNREEDPPA